MEKGTLVELRIHGDRRLAVVDRPEGKKHWQVIDEYGVTHTVHPREIEYAIKSENPFTARQISQFSAQVQPYLDPSSLELAWELLVEDGHLTNATELALLLFSEDSPTATYAAHWLLSQDRLYFKQKGEEYEPRPRAQVYDLKRQAELTAQRAQEAALFQQKLQDALAGIPVTWLSSDRPRWLCLERYVLQGEESSDRPAAQELLQSLGRPKAYEAAWQVLIDLGIWHPHENIFLLRSQIPTTFTPEIMDAAKTCIADPIPDVPERQDLTHLHVYTIDDASTTEIDDGLSVELLADGRSRLWIHIADPTRWLQPDSLLDVDARRRGTSVYLPTGVIPMFPTELATGPMSLVQGKVCHALSFGVILDTEGAVTEFEICPSFIKPNYRLTYEDAEEMLQLGVEDDLEAIAQAARQRSQWRTRQGAIQISLPEAQVKVDPNDLEHLTLELQEPCFSRQLVAEMMILAGEVAARFAQINNVPIPYRTQGTPELPPESTLMQLPPGPVREFAICRCMTKGEIGTSPSRHAGLGLDAYSQVTSPIRRYGDLLAHWQIKAYLSGAPLPFTPQTLSDRLHGIDPAIGEAIQVERQTVRYWSLEYLRRHREVVWRALLLDWLREHERLGLVLLEDIGLKFPMRLERCNAVGMQFQVRAVDVDPRKDLITFIEVANESADDHF
ncbi:MAG: VacB/RNase II family 3'-5' exoribonuclease [Oscillatoriales cyanobacterium SM2_2_1]|nr:VacB/RNase II family 3'-5' exoribonuclease [Oscillatoriales cyanobacterium SM2_2_1]